MRFALIISVALSAASMVTPIMAATMAGPFDGTYSGHVTASPKNAPSCRARQTETLTITNSHLVIERHADHSIRFETDLAADGSFAASDTVTYYRQFFVRSLSGRTDGHTLTARWGTQFCEWSAVLSRVP